MLEPEKYPPVRFVGRTAELKKLHDYLETTIKSGKPGFVFVSGDIGMGKTVLVDRFATEISNSNTGVFVAKSICSEGDELNGLVPFGQILDGLMRKLLNGHQLRKFILDVIPAWLDILAYIPELGAVSAAASALAITVKATKELTRSSYTLDSLNFQFTNALKQLTQNHPCVLFIDNFHWADESSIRLLAHIAVHVTDRPLLFVFTYRPVEALEKEKASASSNLLSVKANIKTARTIDLEAGIDVTEYARERYGMHRFPVSFLNIVQKRTNGLPILVTELFNYWKDARMIQERVNAVGETEWVINKNEDTSLSITSSIDAVLNKRIRLLDQRLQVELQIAAAQGDVFAIQVISAVLNLNADQTAEDLGKLKDQFWIASKQLEERRIGGTFLDLYRFCHPYYREHIYNKIEDPYLRRNLHQRIGDAIEELFQGNPAVAGQLAKHFREAHNERKAAHYALQAAKHEQSRFTWIEGEGWCRFGLEITGKLLANGDNKDLIPLHLDLLECSALGYFHSGEIDQAYDRFKLAISEGDSRGGAPETLVRLSARLAEVCEEKGLYDEGLQVVDRGKQFVDERLRAETEATLDLMVQEAFLQSRFNQHKSSMALLKAAISKLEQRPITPYLQFILALAYNALAVVLGFAARIPESIDWYDKALEVGNAGRLPQTYISTFLSNKAEDLIYLGNLGEAENTLQQALKLATDSGDPTAESWAYYELGLLKLEEDRVDTAVELLEKAMSVAEKVKPELAYFNTDLADAYLRQGKLDKALAHGLRGLHEDAGDLEVQQMFAYGVLAAIESARSNPDGANAYIAAARDLAEATESESTLEFAWAKREFGIAFARIGNIDEAQTLLRESLETFESLNLDYQTRKTRKLLEEFGLEA